MSDKLESVAAVAEENLRMFYATASLGHTFGCHGENAFYTEVRNYFKTPHVAEEGFALYAIAIENFRIYNLWNGHEEGDRYVSGFAKKLLECADEYDGVVGYFGNGKFAFLLPEKAGRVNEVQKRLQETDDRGIEAAGFRPMIGIYHIEDTTLAPETMYDRAAISLQAIRGNYAMRYVHYNPDMDRELDEEIQMLSDIRRGLEAHEFTFYLQPKCDMRTGRILGAEALVRWIHGEQGLVSPGKFIPILEKSGLTVVVDQVVWEDVIKWQREWIDAGNRPLPVSVNISKTDLFAINVADTIIGLCAKYKVPHHLVELEITESAYAEYFDEINAVVKELQEAGFPMLMDDFGSGYSSLNMLKKINFDILKFDMKFLRVEDDMERQRGLEVLESLVNMARLLIVPVIIEGVETQDQVEYLTAMGCRYAQGFFYYRPMPVKEFEELLADDDNVNYDGYVSKRVEQVHMREFLEDMPSTEMMINNMMGPVGFYDVYEDHVEIIRVNEPYYNLFGEGASRSLTVLREHMTTRDYQRLRVLLKEAEEKPMKGASDIFHYMRKDGKSLPVLFRAFYLNEISGHKRFYGSLTDLSIIGDMLKHYGMSEKKPGTGAE